MVYYTVRQEITIGKISFGCELLETKLARQYNVSRTPVRNALQRLDEEGFIAKVSGNYVASFPLLEDIDELSDIYDAIEGFLLKYTISNISSDELEELSRLSGQINQLLSKNVTVFSNYSPLCRKIHYILWTSSRQPQMIRQIKMLPDTWVLSCLLNLFDPKVRLTSIRQHPGIVEAAAQRNLPLLLKRCQEHSQLSRVACKTAYTLLKKTTQFGT